MEREGGEGGTDGGKGEEEGGERGEKGEEVHERLLQAAGDALTAHETPNETFSVGHSKNLQMLLIPILFFARRDQKVCSGN